MVEAGRENVGEGRFVHETAFHLKCFTPGDLIDPSPFALLLSPLSPFTLLQTPDEEASNCMRCSILFNWRRRKSHCRVGNRPRPEEWRSIHSYNPRDSIMPDATIDEFTNK